MLRRSKRNQLRPGQRLIGELADRVLAIRPARWSLAASSDRSGEYLEEMAARLASLALVTALAFAVVAGGYWNYQVVQASHYRQLSESVYRFAPFAMTQDAMTMVHGTNEHVSVEGYARGVRFYYRLVRNVQEL